MQSRAKTFFFCSAKGGVGKTSICTCLALSLLELGKKVLVIDLDFAAAKVEVLLGIKPFRTMQDLPTLNFDFSKIVSSGIWGLDLISCGRGLSWIDNLNKNELGLLFGNWQSFKGSYDFILVDTSPTLQNILLARFFDNGIPVLITTPELPSILDTYLTMKTLAQKVNLNEFKICVNSVESFAESRKVYDVMLKLSLQNFGARLEFLGYILFDSCVSEASKRQKPFVVEFPSSPASRCTREIAKEILISSLVTNSLHTS